MAKRTPKPAARTRAGQDLRARQAGAVRQRPAPAPAAKPQLDKAASFVKPSKADLAARREALHSALRKVAAGKSAPLEAGKLSGPLVSAKPDKRRPRPKLERETPIQSAAAPRFTFPEPSEPAPAPPEPAIGTYRIDQLRFGQCHFATTPHGARSHRFCGAATEVGPGNPHGSWCAEHLPVVTCMPGRSPGGASKADRIAVKEDVA